MRGPMNWGCEDRTSAAALTNVALCTVHYDGQPLRSCVIPTSAVAGAKVVTLEGLDTSAKRDPLQQAFIDEQAAQRLLHSVSYQILT
jgi:aerobic-type carbon monoxide dehydrogenase small subunit (CoxS/CutS family)